MKLKSCCLILLFFPAMIQAWIITIHDCKEDIDYKLIMNDYGQSNWEGTVPPEDVGYLLLHISAQAITYINNGQEEEIQLLREPIQGEATLTPQNLTVEAEIHSVNYTFALIRGGKAKRLVTDLAKDCRQ
ncbi:hypothetical protein [Endozoicomonas arenosclerae]|uniref:hypothetical protein n=1 Tax=Endozoicomonas arenosclerae TaxID=1633495 RepID=UPI00078195B1|nr:hypothetical protein [Endozoicomonas arenosclerae]